MMSGNETRVMYIMSNSHVTSAVPESIEWGVDPTVQFLAEAGKGSTAQGKDIAWG